MRKPLLLKALEALNRRKKPQTGDTSGAAPSLISKAKGMFGDSELEALQKQAAELEANAKALQMPEINAQQTRKQVAKSTSTVSSNSAATTAATETRTPSAREEAENRKADSTTPSTEQVTESSTVKGLAGLKKLVNPDAPENTERHITFNTIGILVGLNREIQMNMSNSLGRRLGFNQDHLTKTLQALFGKAAGRPYTKKEVVRLLSLPQDNWPAGILLYRKILGFDDQTEVDAIGRKLDEIVVEMDRLDELQLFYTALTKIAELKYQIVDETITVDAALKSLDPEIVATDKNFDEAELDAMIAEAGGQAPVMAPGEPVRKAVQETMIAAQDQKINYGEFVASRERMPYMISWRRVYEAIATLDESQESQARLVTLMETIDEVGGLSHGLGGAIIANDEPGRTFADMIQQIAEEFGLQDKPTELEAKLQEIAGQIKARNLNL
ncbi:MAG: hypothetical protein OEY44_01505 [Candidatus Peregrinibacteria bacterium]|nr:hypothetical protein [Candidatus Peregrinibacteria bacterium]